MQFQKIIKVAREFWCIADNIEWKSNVETRWCESVRYLITVNRISGAPEIATEAEILDQGAVYLDDGRGSLTESECRLMLSLCNCNMEMSKVLKSLVSGMMQTEIQYIPSELCSFWILLQLFHFDFQLSFKKQKFCAIIFVYLKLREIVANSK